MIFFRLDFVEFLMAVNLTASKVPEQKIDLFFTMCDIDGNGRIDRQEMHCFFEVCLGKFVRSSLSSFVLL